MKTIVLLKVPNDEERNKFYKVFDLENVSILTFDGKKLKESVLEMMTGDASIRLSQAMFGKSESKFLIREKIYSYVDSLIKEYLEKESSLSENHSILVFENLDKKVSEWLQDDYEIFELEISNREECLYTGSSFYFNSGSFIFKDSVLNLLRKLEIKEERCKV